jgi:hypothetical protein
VQHIARAIRRPIINHHDFGVGRLVVHTFDYLRDGAAFIEAGDDDGQEWHAADYTGRSRA